MKAMEIDWLKDVEGVDSMFVPMTKGRKSASDTTVVVRARVATNAANRATSIMVPETMRSPSIPTTARAGRVNTV